MCGMPATGKDTYVQSTTALKDLPCISFDDAKEELGLKHGENDGKAAHYAIDKAKDLLRAKEPFVWNSTNLSKQIRTKTLDLLHAYKAQTNLVYLEKDKKTILKRNSERDFSLTNKKLLEMLNKWEVPTLDECHSIQYFLN